jgi:hypothetical protein
MSNLDGVLPPYDHEAAMRLLDAINDPDWEAKRMDLVTLSPERRETERASLFAKVMRRLYTMSGWGKDAGYHEHQIRRFFRSGFPPDELEALLSVLDPAEVEWINV